MLTKLSTYGSRKVGGFKSRVGRLSKPKPTIEAPPSQQSLFFLRLPLELRREILAFAFGNRTVHAVLIFKLGRVGLDLEHALWERGMPVSQWTGCICQCGPADGEHFGTKLLHDRCAKDRSALWSSEGRESPLHSIGALGWLLTCRQAYNEGVHILYGTNTFRISDIGRNTGRLELPRTRGRALIRSVEVALWIYGLGRASHSTMEMEPGTCSVRDIPTFLQPDLLPNLRRLYLGVRAEMDRVQTRESASIQLRMAKMDTFAPLDHVARKMLRAGLEELEVGVPTSAFHAMYTMGVEAGRPFQTPGWTPEMGENQNGSWYSRKRVWRPASGEEDDLDEKLGYWVSETDSDMPEGWQDSMDRYWEG